MTSKLNMSATISRAAAMTDMTFEPTRSSPPPARHSPRLISRFRPDQFIFAITPNQDVLRKLLLVLGRVPGNRRKPDDAPSMISQAVDAEQNADSSRHLTASCFSRAFR